MGHDLSSRQERAGRSQPLFRSVNERLTRLDAGVPELAGEDRYVISCECADRDCTEMQTLRAGDYDAIRTDPAHFAVLRRHEHREVEDVVGVFGGGLIVQKLGAGAAIAEGVADGR